MYSPIIQDFLGYAIVWHTPLISIPMFVLFVAVSAIHCFFADGRLVLLLIVDGNFAVVVFLLLVGVVLLRSNMVLPARVATRMDQLGLSW